ncbi:MAG: GYF domain-containing protein [Rhizomicrobium sp.]
MADSWTINVGGQIYGPYTTQEMGSFTGEGRLAPYSQVAPSGSNDYHPANSYAELAALFTPADASKAIPTPLSTEDVGGLARYVIVADMKSRSIAGIENEIAQFGTSYPLTSQSWVLVSESPLNLIRNALMQLIGNVDHLFIVDVTHNKAVWFNYGPEAESRIRQTWLKA